LPEKPVKFSDSSTDSDGVEIPPNVWMFSMIRFVDAHIRAMSRLRFSGKLWLITAAFLLPLCIALCGLCAEWTTERDFTRRERALLTSLETRARAAHAPLGSRGLSPREHAETQLERLDLARADGILRRQYLVATGLFLALGLAAYVVLAFWASIQRTIQLLIRSPDDIMVASDAQLYGMANGFEDEFGLVARAMAVAGVSLRNQRQAAVLEAERARAAQAEVRRQEQRIRSLIEHALDGIALTDEQQHITEWNSAAARILGWTKAEALNFRLAELVPASTDRDASKATSPTHGARATTVSRKDGTQVVLEHVLVEIPTESGTAAGVFFRDISMRKLLETQVRQTQKFESIAQIASGLAHELNTPVQYASDSVHFAQESVVDLFELITRLEQLLEARSSLEDPAVEIARAKDSADYEYVRDHLSNALGRALEGLTRVATLIGSLREFTSVDQRGMKFVDVNRLLQHAVSIARSESKQIAEVELDSGEIPLVQCDGSEIVQVLLTLLTNASQAISDRKANADSGRIRIRTTSLSDSVLISVHDNGSGVQPAIAHRIFEPFFTTKEPGRGTGQGLALSYNTVVLKHRGALYFESPPGEGTTFFVRLPIHHPSTLEVSAA
jgi:PAS domain S-box-containing protein